MTEFSCVFWNTYINMLLFQVSTMVVEYVWYMITNGETQGECNEDGTAYFKITSQNFPGFDTKDAWKWRQ
jgi:hypothetical protein